MEQQQPNYSQIQYQNEINEILTYLFVYNTPSIKRQQYADIQKRLSTLDITAYYVLFSLVEKQLPHRARMLFCGENYQGKIEFLHEVCAHLAELPLKCVN